LLAFNPIRLEMEQIADETGVEPLRVSFVAALRLIVEEWGWATITASPGAIPRHLGDLRDKVRRFILPERRPARVYPRAVKLKMSHYARKRPAAKKRTTGRLIAPLVLPARVAGVVGAGRRGLLRAPQTQRLKATRDPYARMLRPSRASTCRARRARRMRAPPRRRTPAKARRATPAL
jgi:hypothetical protein